jgi:protein O-mannosyl-transferase
MTSVEVNPDVTTVVQPKSGLAGVLKRPVVLSVLLVVATLALYYPVHRYSFVNYDDRDYVYENKPVQSGLSWATVKWAFTTSHAGNWHPLTWLSHALDCQIFGAEPGGPHDVNVLLQGFNVVLLFWVLRRATGFTVRSFMVAALFALHPINVESVAWISERKNILSLMFFLLALGAYRWYASRPGVVRYLTVALLFALGLMAKPQIITFPFVLLLWDFWPLQRMFPADGSSTGDARPAAKYPAKSLSWLILEKLPLLAIVAVSAVVTMKVQHGARQWFPRAARVGNALLSYGLYIKKLIWPTGLATLYPHPGASLNWWEASAAGVILLVITLLVIMGRHRYLPVGWFWFLGTLVPMLGIVQVGQQAMADRYAYVSFLGLFIIICWGTADLAEHVRLPRALLPAVSAAALAILALLSRRQINYWQSDETLWAHALQVTTRNWVAESELATALAVDGRVQEAVPHFYRALDMNPSDGTANMGIAIYLLQSGDFRDAIPYYQRVVKDPGAKTDKVVNAWAGMAKAYRALGERDQFEECLRQGQKVRREMETSTSVQ